MTIPQLIHQTFKSSDLPEQYALLQASVLKHHPDWDYKLWTDRDNREFIASHHGWFLETYDSYRHEIERVDAVRYFILLTYGGVYLDLDMECLKPLDPIFDEPGLPYFGTLALPTIDNSIIGNAFMASPAGQPFFRYLVGQLAGLRENGDITHKNVFNNTGPDMLTAHLAAFEKISAYRVVGLDKVCDLGVLHENPVTAGKNLAEVRDKALLYLIHHHTNSWNIQHPPPPDIPGYQLYLDMDIAGCDIDYIEYSHGNYEYIANCCRANGDAIGFNYNGYIKGCGGELAPISRNADWLKEGMRAWICLKEGYLKRP